MFSYWVIFSCIDIFSCWLLHEATLNGPLIFTLKKLQSPRLIPMPWSSLGPSQNVRSEPSEITWAPGRAWELALIHHYYILLHFFWDKCNQARKKNLLKAMIIWYCIGLNIVYSGMLSPNFYILVPWLPQRTLVPSCFYLSFISHLSIFPLFSNYCIYM